MQRRTNPNVPTNIDDQDGARDIDDIDENDEPGDRGHAPYSGVRRMPPGMRSPVSVPNHHKLVGWNKTVYDYTNPDRPVVTQHRAHRKPIFGAGK